MLTCYPLPKPHLHVLSTYYLLPKCCLPMLSTYLSRPKLHLPLLCTYYPLLKHLYSCLMYLSSAEASSTYVMYLPSGKALSTCIRYLPSAKALSTCIRYLSCAEASSAYVMHLLSSAEALSACAMQYLADLSLIYSASYVRSRHTYRKREEIKQVRPKKRENSSQHFYVKYMKKMCLIHGNALIFTLKVCYFFTLVFNKGENKFYK